MKHTIAFKVFAIIFNYFIVFFTDLKNAIEHDYNEMQ